MKEDLAALLERIKGQLDPADYHEIARRLELADVLATGLRDMTQNLKSTLEGLKDLERPVPSLSSSLKGVRFE